MRQLGGVSVGVDQVDQVPHRLAELGDRARDRRDAEHDEPRRGEHRLEEDVHGSSAVAGHRQRGDPGARVEVGLGRQRDQPRLAVDERLRRLAQDLRPGAVAAEPAVVAAVGR